MRAATFDSSFWVHAVYLDLVELLLADFELICTRAVEDELGRDNPTSRRLKALLLTEASRELHQDRRRLNCTEMGREPLLTSLWSESSYCSLMTGDLMRRHRQPELRSLTL